MNILYHHRTQGAGTEGVHIREVANALKTLGHQVNMISPPGVDPFREGEPKAETSSIIKAVLKTMVRSLPQFCFECAEIGYNSYASNRMRSALAKSTPDLIYERYAFFCRAPSRLSKAKGIPHILEVNEISGIKRQRAQAMVGLCRKYEDEIFRNVLAIVVVSDFLKGEIVARGIDPAKVSVIPNAINPRDFNPDIDVSDLRKSLSLYGKRVITFVGMFSTWDCLEFLLDSFLEVKKACPHAHLVIVGDGVDRLNLEAKALVLGLAADVTFTGKVPRKDVARYIGLADFCVLSGSNPFGSPIALFEYMAMGKTVVVPDFSPITAIVENHVDGLVFHPDTPGLFATHMIDLVRNDEKRLRMSVAARAKIKGHFTWENNARKIIQIVEKVKHENIC